MSIPQYDKIVEDLNDKIAEFNTLAEQGKDGYGSKKHALAARKLSLEIQKMLQEFRKLSIQNDKEK